MSVGINEFAFRQTAESPFSHFCGNWDELSELVASNMGTGKPGYRDGVMLVAVPSEKFMTGLVEVTAETELVAKLVRRSENEEPYIAVYAKGGDKSPAKSVNVVLYRHDVLMEDNDATTTHEWEVVAILASPDEGEHPMDPVTMMRNFLHLPGGTQGEFTAMEFAVSIRAAQRYVSILPAGE